MDDFSRMSDADGELDVAVVDHGSNREPQIGTSIRSPVSKTRSLSDGGGTPKLSPSPHIIEAVRRQSKDDIAIREKNREHVQVAPSTPVRTGYPLRGLSLQMSARDPASPASQSGFRPAPLSPKLDHSHTYASPTNILPRRSRGLDFSRAATNLHHSTLARQTTPDSSPTLGSRAMNIPGRHPGEYGAGEQPSTSLWSMMGNHERMHVSSSVGSTNHVPSDLSSTSDDDDYMDEDMDDAYINTPQVSKIGMPGGSTMGAPWMPGSPAANSLASFQQRQRQRKHPVKKKARGPLGLFHSPAAPSAISKSPPNSLGGLRDMSPHARRESISWAANQLHISGNESDDSLSRQLDGVDSPLRPSIVRRAVTRRGNLLPKTKGFARIRAALAEESAPIDAEFKREAEVVRQVRESDMDLEPRHSIPQSMPSTALSSPNLATHDSMEEIVDDMMMIDPTASALGVGTFKQQALKNSKGKVFWDTFSETSSTGAPARTTPPPPGFGLLRASSTGLSLEDVSMGSPSASSNGGTSQSNNPFIILGNGQTTTTSSSGNGTPSHPPPPAPSNNNPSTTTNTHPAGNNQGLTGIPPTAAEITRRIQSKRRRCDTDDFDPVSIKRRAVSPGMSVHNSPVMQSPMQRDMAPWGGPGVRWGSRGRGAWAGMGVLWGLGRGGGWRGSGGSGGSGSGAGSESGSIHGGGGGGRGKGFGRVGLQGMVETHDGITRLSIE